MRRLLVGCVLCVAALVSSSCSAPKAILCTISCPVYQPPETPHPDWPTQCGGHQEPACGGGTLGTDRVAARNEGWPDG